MAVNKTLKISLLANLVLGAVSLLLISEFCLPRDIEFTGGIFNYGMMLYGKFKFEGDSDNFAIYDQTDRGLVIDGAVLTCIRKSYTLGYYLGKVTVTDGSKKIEVSKIYFELLPSGKINYYLPTADGKSYDNSKEFSSDDIAFH